MKRNLKNIIIMLFVLFVMGITKSYCSSIEDNANTLNLSEYNNSEIVEIEDVGTCQIYSEGDLTINLEGKNFLNVEAKYGIFCEGIVNIIGNGELEIGNVEVGIYATKGVYINNKKVTINNTDKNSIYVHWGNMEIKDSEINVKHWLKAGDITINNSNIIASCIQTDNLIINNSNVDIVRSDKEFVGIMSTEAGISTSDLKITNSQLKVTSDTYGISAYNFEITNSDIYASAESWDGIDSSTLIFNSGRINASGSTAIHARKFTMHDGEVIANGSEEGFYSSFGEFNINGGKIRIESKENKTETGMELSNTNLNIRGGKIDILTDLYGIDIDSASMFVEDGQINIKAENGINVSGFSSDGYVNIKGGQIKIDSLNLALSMNMDKFIIPNNAKMMAGRSEKNKKEVSAYEGEKYLEIKILPFSDVSKNSFYYTSVEYCYENNIILGTTKETFSPSKKLSRANIVTMLWRMEGSPNIVSENSFPDVKSTDYFYNAVLWSSSNRIASGYSTTGKFGPNDNITREQLATLLRNYAKYKNKDVSASADLIKFKDKNGVSSYAKEGIEWAIANKIMNGKDNGTRIDPKGNASRAEVAVMITNYCNKIGR